MRPGWRNREDEASRVKQKDMVALSEFHLYKEVCKRCPNSVIFMILYDSKISDSLTCSISFWTDVPRWLGTRYKEVDLGSI